MAKKQKDYTAAELRELRLRLGLTQAAIAEKVGVARRTWMYYEAGKQSPSRSVVLLIRQLEKP